MTEQTKLPDEQLKAIIYDDDENFESVTTASIDSQSRWSTSFSQVFKDNRDGTLIEISWSRGSTEVQDEGPDDFEYHKVKAVERTVTAYERCG